MQSSKRLRQLRYHPVEQEAREDLGHARGRGHDNCQSRNAGFRKLRNCRRTPQLHARKSLLGNPVQPLGTSSRADASRSHKADTRTQRTTASTAEGRGVLRSRVNALNSFLFLFCFPSENPHTSFTSL